MLFQLQERHYARFNLPNVRVQQSVDPAAVLRGPVAQIKQHLDFVQRHVEGTTVAYELQALDVFVPVEPEVAAAACGFWQQAFLLVIADGDDLAPRSLG